MPTSSIERRDLGEEKPIVFIRVQVERAHLGDALERCFGLVFAHCAKAGLENPGTPFTRYQDIQDSLLTIEAGCLLEERIPGRDTIEVGSLVDGPVAFAVHEGSYDTLGETYADLESWMETHDCRPAGAPWEVYVTDPGEHEDPADWRTEVYWPIVDR